MKEKLSRVFKIVLIALILSSQIVAFSIEAETYREFGYDPEYRGKDDVDTLKDDSSEVLLEQENLKTSEMVTDVKEGLSDGGKESLLNTKSSGKYVLATDKDFSGTSNGSFRYIGKDNYVEIPSVIKGINVTSYANMFEGTSVKGVKSNNNKVTSFSYMFRDNQATELDLSLLDTSNVVNMFGMLQGTQARSLDLSSFDTTKVENMSYMFSQTEARDINLTSFDTKNVKSMDYMFFSSKVSSLNLETFNTSNVTRMNYMFRDTQVYELDLSSFDTSKVDSMVGMFRNSGAVLGYARSQADADRLNASSNKPSWLTFTAPDPFSAIFTPNGNTTWAKQFSFRFDLKQYDSNEPVQTVWSTMSSGSYIKEGWGTTYNQGVAYTQGSLTGGYYLHIKAKDNLGNTVYARSGRFNFDNTAPTLTLTPNVTSPTNANVEVTATGRDYNSGVKRIRQGSGTWVDGSSLQFTASENGEYNFTVEDIAGNITTKTIEVSNIDKQPPVLTITPNTTNETTDSVILTVDATDSLSGVKRIQLPTGKWVNGSEATFEVNDNGSYTFKAEDNAGNVTTKTHSVNNLIRTRTLKAPKVDNFDNITIPNETAEYTTEVSSLGVSDWTLASDNWRVLVTATQVQRGNGNDKLPTGSLTLQDVKSISKPNGVVTKGYNGKQVIDKGNVVLLDGSNTFGEVTAQFGQDALGLTIDPSIVKQGTYSTTITWSLVTAP